MNHRIDHPPTITKQVHRQRAFYSLEWSPLLPVSRYRINSGVPSLSGIWELYWLEHSRVPHLLKMGRAWYGGLRHQLRQESDPSVANNREIADYLASGDSYYRYTVCEIAADLEEVYDVLTTLRGVPSPPAPPQRYREVRIREKDEMIIHRSRTPSQTQKPPESYGHQVPNMFDVMEEMRRMDREQQGDR